MAKSKHRLTQKFIVCWKEKRMSDARLAAKFNLNLMEVVQIKNRLNNIGDSAKELPKSPATSPKSDTPPPIRDQTASPPQTVKESVTADPAFSHASETINAPKPASLRAGKESTAPISTPPKPKANVNISELFDTARTLESEIGEMEQELEKLRLAML